MNYIKRLFSKKATNTRIINNSYFLNDNEYKKMRELGSNTVKMESGNGIGIGIKCLDIKGDWIDITDYGCW